MVGVVIFGYIKQQCWFVVQWFLVLFNVLVMWVDYQNFIVVVSGVYVIGLCGVVQVGYLFIGIFNLCFQFQGSGVNYLDLCWVGDCVNVESIIQ